MWRSSHEFDLVERARRRHREEIPIADVLEREPPIAVGVVFQPVIAAVFANPRFADPLVQGDRPLQEPGAGNRRVMDHHPALVFVFALDEVVGDLSLHEIRLLPGLMLPLFKLSHLLRERVGFPREFLRLLRRRARVRSDGQGLDIPADLLQVALFLGNRGRTNAPIPIIGGEEKIEDLALRGVALRAGDVGNRRAALRSNEVGDAILVVAALELRDVGQPSLFDKPAPGDALPGLRLQPVDHVFHHLREGLGPMVHRQFVAVAAHLVLVVLRHQRAAFPRRNGELVLSSLPDLLPAFLQ